MPIRQPARHNPNELFFRKELNLGEVKRPQPEYCLVLAWDDYALVRCELAEFKPEV